MLIALASVVTGAHCMTISPQNSPVHDVNSNIAEKLMAHKKGLDGTYLKPTMAECYNEFKKAIPKLTIDSTARMQAKLELAEKENSELRKNNKTNEIRLNALEKWAAEQSEKKLLRKSF